MTRRQQTTVAKKPVVKQPAANPPKPPKPTAPREPTTAEIVEAKMRKMAEDPNAYPVYWTETGPDAKDWRFLFPEVEIFDNALKGGYGWYDICYDRGRHLLPKYQPYKIINVTKEELKAIRAREAEEEAQKAAVKKAEREKQERAWCEEAEAKAAEAATKAAVKAAEEAAEAVCREAMAREDAAAIERRYREDLAAAVDKFVAKIAGMPEELRTTDKLADLIVNETCVLPEDDQLPIALEIAQKVQDNFLVFVTPCSSPSPELEEILEREAPRPLPVVKATIVPTRPLDLVNDTIDGVPAYLFWICYLLELNKEFINSGPVFINEYMYYPVVDFKGNRAYYPFKLAEAVPPPPPPQPQQPTNTWYPPLPREPPPATRLPPLLPTPPPSQRLMPQMKKLRIPRASRIQSLLSRPLPSHTPVKHTPTEKRDWHNQESRERLRASFVCC